MAYSSLVRWGLFGGSVRPSGFDLKETRSGSHIQLVFRRTPDHKMGMFAVFSPGKKQEQRHVARDQLPTELHVRPSSRDARRMI
jgi:hypothetical protein